MKKTASEELNKMEIEKRELIEIVNSFKNPKTVRYILGFVKKFVEVRS